jgi:hypothetical protein
MMSMVKNHLLDAGAAQDAVADLIKHGRHHMDGYELAKALDDYAHWDCNFEMVEILDGFSSAVSSQIDRAEKDWANLTSPQPPHPIGTRVKLFRGELGTIDGIYEYGAAKYLVKIDGSTGNGRRIINFEDAVPVPDAAAA